MDETSARPGANGERTHCRRGHPYHGPNLQITPSGGRQCKACRRESGKRAYEKKRLPPDVAFANRLYAKAVPVTESGCWLWVGRLRNGYGSIKRDRRFLGAHRVSYQLAYGVSPDHLFVCHKCDTKSCINPDHLFLGTAADNTADMKRKGRARFGPNQPKQEGRRKWHNK